MVYPRFVNSQLPFHLNCERISMIIQEVLKGIGGIDEDDVDSIFASGIICNWWRKVGSLPAVEVPLRLTKRNLYWHQNRYEDPDPLRGNAEFREHTPFISTTAGSVERDAFDQTNTLYPAWWEALRFATNFWTTDGWIFYCYVWILGRKAIGHQAFAEELRELHVYSDFSLFQLEGEITAKIQIPTAQIQKAQEWRLSDIQIALNNGNLPTPFQTKINDRFSDPSTYNNVRPALA
jgi:hypothetical protein